MFAAFMQRLARSASLLRSCKYFVRCKFVRCKKGVTAVEFALVAAPFLALLVALFQTAIVFFAGRVLDETTMQASRVILTGQAQNSNMTQAQFATAVCNNTFALFNCSNFMINVQTYSSFLVGQHIGADFDLQFQGSSNQYHGVFRQAGRGTSWLSRSCTNGRSSSARSASIFPTSRTAIAC